MSWRIRFSKRRATAETSTNLMVCQAIVRIPVIDIACSQTVMVSSPSIKPWMTAIFESLKLNMLSPCLKSSIQASLTLEIPGNGGRLGLADVKHE